MHTVVKMLSLVFVLCAGSSAFSVTNGKTFSTIARGTEIDKLSLSTVIIEKRTGYFFRREIRSCSGIVISDNSVLTAGHCIGNGCDFISNKRDVTFRIASGERVVNGEQIASIYDGVVINSKDQGSDLAIIRFKGQPFTGLTFPGALEVNDNAGENNVRNVSNLLWNGNPTIYFFGFGTSDEFKYIEINSYDPLIFTNHKPLGGNFAYPILHGDKTALYGSPRKYYGGHIHNRRFEEHPQADNLNTNMLLIPPGVFEHGDSGGAVIICINRVSGCGLIGIIHGSSGDYYTRSDIPYGLVTLLSNPYYHNLLRMAQTDPPRWH